MSHVKIIARSEECDIFQSIMRSQEAEFVAIYGRRRVGKTYLVRSYFGSIKDVIFFVATGAKATPMAEQLNHFMQMVSEIFYAGAALESVKNWNAAFKQLHQAIVRLPQRQDVVLFLDELPWMATKNSRLLQTLEYYWNQHWAFDPRVKLIVCGSSASWIIRKIINNKGGLHNRITRKICLKPFSLAQTKKYLAAKRVQLKDQQVADIFMVTGGIPYYLNAVKKGETASQTIERLAFTQNSLLLNEFDNLFSALFDDVESYIEILRILAMHHEGISKADLVKKSANLSAGGGLTNKLDDLHLAGFILPFHSYQSSSKNTYYRVIDQYTLFYFRWIEPIKKSLMTMALDKGYWQAIYGNHEWCSWSGYAFEVICYQHISAIRKALQLLPTALPYGWRYTPTKKANEKGAQIDLLFDRQDDGITLCEIKYTRSAFVVNKEYAKNLLNKKQVFCQKTRTKKQIFVALVSANGVKDTVYSDDIVCAVVTLTDLFA